MSDVVPIDATAEEEPEYDEQMWDALNKALEVHGTVINDLQFAINAILQYRRALKMLGGPDPQESAAEYLIMKYKMGKEGKSDKWEDDTRTLVNQKRKEVNA